MNTETADALVAVFGAMGLTSIRVGNQVSPVSQTGLLGAVIDLEAWALIAAAGRFDVGVKDLRGVAQAKEPRRAARALLARAELRRSARSSERCCATCSTLDPRTGICKAQNTATLVSVGGQMSDLVCGAWRPR